MLSVNLLLGGQRLTGTGLTPRWGSFVLFPDTLHYISPVLSLHFYKAHKVPGVTVDRNVWGSFSSSESPEWYFSAFIKPEGVALSCALALLQATGVRLWGWSIEFSNSLFTWGLKGRKIASRPLGLTWRVSNIMVVMWAVCKLCPPPPNTCSSLVCCSVEICNSWNW